MFKIKQSFKQCLHDHASQHTELAEPFYGFTKSPNHHELMSADILCLSETFCTQSTNVNDLALPGYYFLQKTRQASYSSQTNWKWKKEVALEFSSRIIIP